MKGFLAAALVCLAPAFADEPAMKRVEPQYDKGAIRLYEGAAPGFESATQKEVWTLFEGRERWVRNVTVPTLLPVLPKKNKATGAAVLVIPGGGFQFVSIDNEGYPIAEWLAARGVAAFVLKYRPMVTPEGETEFGAFIARAWNPATPAEEQPDLNAGLALAAADASAAMALIHQRADEWGLDKERIGAIGFSAGAMAALRLVATQDGAARPDFLGYIYGPMGRTEVPSNAPPLFAALAKDDPLFGAEGFGLVEAWREAGASVELHYYAGGGHGFGSQKLGQPSDLWFDQFAKWLGPIGALKE
jgi:acetyl esterase/lipase